MITRVIKKQEKAGTASANRAGESGGHPEPLSGDFRGQSPLRKILGSKEHLAWLKIVLNVTEITTVQD